MTAHTTPMSPEQQREALLESERKANENQPRNFKDDALTDKVVQVAPDGTGPTPTDTFDPQTDQLAEATAGKVDRATDRKNSTT